MRRHFTAAGIGGALPVSSRNLIDHGGAKSFRRLRHDFEEAECSLPFGPKRPMVSRPEEEIWKVPERPALVQHTSKMPNVSA